MKRIVFQQNWNNKLFCDYFTTLRPFNQEYYKKGETFTIHLKDKAVGAAVIVDTQKIKLVNVSNGFALVDAGMPKNKFIGMLKTMYRNRINNIDNQVFSILFLKRL